jgi:hypothetical protein
MRARAGALAGKFDPRQNKGGVERQNCGIPELQETTPMPSIPLRPIPGTTLFDGGQAR